MNAVFYFELTETVQCACVSTIKIIEPGHVIPNNVAF